MAVEKFGENFYAHGVVSDLDVIKVCIDHMERLEEVLQAYREWEQTLALNKEAWGPDGVKMTIEQAEKLADIAEMRQKVLNRRVIDSTRFTKQ